MIAKQAKEIARRWVKNEVSKWAGFLGAFYHGSINWLPDDALLSPNSDLDVMVVFDDPPPIKLGKFIYEDVMLEVSYLAASEVKSAEQVLAIPHLAGSFEKFSIIVDPTGHLTRLQAEVAASYAKREWVEKRCEFSRDKVLSGLQSIGASEPFCQQVMTWLFATGVTTHILLVAGLKNPTVRKRYLAVKELLGEYKQSDFYEPLIELLDCNTMSKEQVSAHLATLTKVFDATVPVVKTPIFFASDLTECARPLAIDGSRALIEADHHREAIFWIVATYARCLMVLHTDGTEEMQGQFVLGFRALLADLGIVSFADIQRREEKVKTLMPQIWAVKDHIIDMNSAIVYS